MAETSELRDIICDGPHVSMKKLGESGPMVPKDRKKYSDIDKCHRKELSRQENLGTTQVKQSKIDMLTTKYEFFKMKDDESIQDMHTRFTSIINEPHSLGDVIPRNKLVRNILSVLPGSWESKTYEMKRKKASERREPKKEKNLVLKAENNDSSEEDSDMAYLTKRFQKMEQYKQNSDKVAKRNPVLDKRFSRKSVADNIVKQALTAWGDSSSESEREPDAENSSMMAVETKATKLDSLFALMAQSNDDEDDENDEVNFRDVQRNLKSYSSKKLSSLTNVLIDAYYSLDNDKEILTIEIGEAEQSRDDLVVCVVELNETIANLGKEKEVLNEKINSVENKRDDLMVVVVDLKETIEDLSNEKHTLEEKVVSTEQERDDFLVIITYLEETIEGLNSEYRTVNLGKGKEVASDTHIKLEKELNDVKTSLCGELEKNRQLQAELERVKIDLEKSLKWTWSSDAVTAMYFNNSENRQGMRFQKKKTPYNPHNKYVTIPQIWLCTHCGNNGHFKENCQARVQSIQKNKVFTEKVTTKEGPGNSEKKWTAMVHEQWMLKTPRIVSH
ncbi:uncharacterized protein [Nicotiana sylvestris]|uniref:uncharacterized protein n=1 Tax=Nicotiana sylvestris TaxID=4096 RepID=UPI00388C53A1